MVRSGFDQSDKDQLNCGLRLCQKKSNKRTILIKVFRLYKILAEMLP